MDKVLEAPVLERGTSPSKDYFTECFISEKGELTNKYEDR